MKLLLDDRLAPITSTAGFLEAPWDVVGEALCRWAGRRRKLRKVPLADPIPDVLHRLEPLTIPVVERELLLSTRSSWTAYFNNWLPGTDPFSVVGHLTQVLECRGLIVRCIPHTIVREPGRPAVGRFGCVEFQLYGPERTDWLNLVRGIRVAADIRGWEFQVSGTPQPFERPEQYRARRKRDRFTPEMLDEYCRKLGVRYFDPTYYGPESLLVESVGPISSSAEVRALSLAEVQREQGILENPSWTEKGADCNSDSHRS